MAPNMYTRYVMSTVPLGPHLHFYDGKIFLIVKKRIESLSLPLNNIFLLTDYSLVHLR